MTQKILVMGGTRFFGRRLVKLLADADCDVTVATRGKTTVAMPANVKHVVMDRERPNDLERVAGLNPWDVVYDQIGFSPDNANAVVSAFAGRTQRLIFTSSGSVYEPGPNLKESAFNPRNYTLRSGSANDLGFVEGKRLAEAVYAQTAAFPVTIVRFPVVLGADDFTRRLNFVIEHLRRGDSMCFPNLAVKISLVEASDAARFLLFLKDKPHLGPLNGASPDSVAVGDLIKSIASQVGVPIRYAKTPTDKNLTPFSFDLDFYLDVSGAERLGFHFRKIGEWLPDLVEELCRD